MADTPAAALADALVVSDHGPGWIADERSHAIAADILARLAAAGWRLVPVIEKTPGVAEDRKDGLG